MDLNQGVFGNCGKFGVVMGETQVGYSSAMGDYGLSQRLVSGSTKQRNGAIIGSTLTKSYYPPAKKRTELLLSQPTALYSSEVFDLVVIVVKGAEVLR